MADPKHQRAAAAPNGRDSDPTLAALDLTQQHRVQSEDIVLGCALCARADAEELVGTLAAADFSAARVRVFLAIEALLGKGKTPDVGAVLEELRRAGVAEPYERPAPEEARDDWPKFLSDLTGWGTIPSSFRHHLRQVQEAGILRRLGAGLCELQARAADPGTDLTELLRDADALLSGCERTAAGAAEWTEGCVGIREAYARATAAERPAGVPSGFSVIDGVTGGWQPSDLILLAAEPGIGKTALALTFMLRAAAAGFRAAFFSVEMSTQHLFDRVLHAEARVDQVPLRKRSPTLAEAQRLEAAQSRLWELPYSVIDRAASLAQLRAEAKRAVREGGAHLLLVDYLQRVQVGRGEPADSRNQELGLIARSLKSIARELNVPLIAVSSLSRQVNRREGRRPVRSDLRDSGDLEYEADVIMLLYRPSLAAKDGSKPDPDRLDTVEVIFDKHRKGAEDVVRLGFIPRFARYEEMSWRDEAESGRGEEA